MTIEDKFLDSRDKSYKPSQHSDKLIITERNVRVQYKKSYGGMSPYFQGIMQGKDAVLRYTSCPNKDGHDELKIIRYQVPRGDCPECYGKTKWETLTGETNFYVETKSTAVNLAGISFMNDLPVTVAWIKAVLPGNIELDTLTAGMVKADDYNAIVNGDELRPVFRKEPLASASDVMWVKKGASREALPKGYIASKHYAI
ncbi:hypothetical protein UR09_01245 [Candidatus Nitromaritima sp. SCGC AAA799-A02]|nr:hypothetical protein UZ36_04070 [Candidatus Nitromaritima sp. SCGC AAA799-C22]KMP12385.1 hypothetical protein UR09_01245 [Candidatus Nitromaritima sp. SCGC AAA799-A02]